MIVKHPLVRFYEKTQPSPDGCILWTKSTDDTGYGKFYAGPPARSSTFERAHRWIWMHHNGPIPDGLVLRHTCDVYACVSMDHLILGTQAQNVEDMVQRGRHSQKSRTHCAQGHEFTPENTRIYAKGKKRQCKTCSRRWNAEYRQRQRALKSDREISVRSAPRVEQRALHQHTN